MPIRTGRLPLHITEDPQLGDARRLGADDRGGRVRGGLKVGGASALSPAQALNLMELRRDPVSRRRRGAAVPCRHQGVDRPLPPRAMEAAARRRPRLTPLTVRDAIRIQAGGGCPTTRLPPGLRSAPLTAGHFTSTVRYTNQKGLRRPAGDATDGAWSGAGQSPPPPRPSPLHTAYGARRPAASWRRSSPRLTRTVATTCWPTATQRPHRCRLIRFMVEQKQI